MQDIWNAVREGAGLRPRVLLRHHPEHGRRDHPAHRLGPADPLPADGEAGEVDDRHAARAAGDQEAPGEVQERPPEAQRRDDEVLQGEQDQPARRVVCPLLVQMPIFIALFQTLHDIQNFIPQDSAMYQSICGNDVPSKCTPDMHFAGMNLTKSASSVPSSGFSNLLPYLVLVGDRGGHRLHPAASDDAQPEPAEPADGDHRQGLPDRVRLHLVDRGRRCGALLRHDQPLADRPAGAGVPQDRLEGRSPTQVRRWRFEVEGPATTDPSRPRTKDRRRHREAGDEVEAQAGGGRRAVAAASSDKNGSGKAAAAPTTGRRRTQRPGRRRSNRKRKR